MAEQDPQNTSLIKQHPRKFAAGVSSFTTYLVSTLAGAGGETSIVLVLIATFLVVIGVDWWMLKHPRGSKHQTDPGAYVDDLVIGNNKEKKPSIDTSVVMSHQDILQEQNAMLEQQAGMLSISPDPKGGQLSHPDRD